MNRSGDRVARALLSFAVLCCGSAVEARAGMKIELRPWPPAARAAVSIAFDDAYNSHVSQAMPLLESHGFRGTFYLIVNKLLRRGRYQYARRSASISRWQAGASRGHELASHTVSHAALDTIGIDRVRDELIRSKAMLDSLFDGEPVVSLAYPYSRTNAAVAEVAGQVYRNARGGEPEDGGDLHNDPASLDFMLLKGFFPCGPVDEWNDTVARAIHGRGWLIESFHPIGEPGFCSVRTGAFSEHLDHLSLQGSDLWVAPVRDVVNRIRQWRLLEVEATSLSGRGYRLRIAGQEDYVSDWQVAVYLDHPDFWEVADDKGQVLSSTMEGEALVFSWPRERARDELFLTLKDKTSTSRSGWGGLKNAILEQAPP